MKTIIIIPIISNRSYIFASYFSKLEKLPKSRIEHFPRILLHARSSNTSLSTFLRARDIGMALYAHAASTSYIHTYIREEKRRKNTCWPGKYVAEEKGKARARRKSRQEVIWWGGGMGKRRGAREERGGESRKEELSRIEVSETAGCSHQE